MAPAAKPVEILYEKGNKEHSAIINAALDRASLSTEWKKDNAKAFSNFIDGANLNEIDDLVSNFLKEV